MHCPRSLRCVSVRLRGRIGSASLRVLHPYDASAPGAPFCYDRRVPAAGGRRRYPPTGSALGLSQPLGGFSRDSALEPELPRTQPSPPLRPRTSRPCFMPHASLGFSLQSLPLSKSRAALSAALCFLAVSIATASPARKTPGCPTGFPRPPTLGRAPRPLAKAFMSATRKTGVEASFSRPSRPPVLRALPHADLGDRLKPSGLAGTRPCRPLRSLAPFESPFSRCDRALPRARARARPRPSGPLLS